MRGRQRAGGWPCVGVGGRVGARGDTPERAAGRAGMSGGAGLLAAPAAPGSGGIVDETRLGGGGGGRGEGTVGKMMGSEEKKKKKLSLFISHLHTMSTLEPFLLLAKSARGKAAASIIDWATQEAGVFVFGELLDMPGVKEVR